MECVTVNIIWKILHNRWTVVLQLEWSVLQWTLCGRYFTTGEQWYCSLNGVCYSEHYMEDNLQQVDSGIAAWMECVTVNIIWKILHNRWTVLLQLEWSVLQWKLSGRYFTTGGQWYCSLNGECYSEHYPEDTSKQLDSVIAAWMECVTVNIICTSQQVDSCIVAWMECVTVNIIWMILHSRRTVLLQLEWSVLQWTLCGRYFTEGGQLHCSLNGVCYSEHYVEDTSQQVDGGIAAWMECVTGTLCGRYFTGGGQW